MEATYINDLIARDHIPQARHLAEEWTVAQPNDVLAMQYEVMTRLFDGDVEAAMQSCYKALALAPELPRNKANLGITLLSQGRYNEGLALYEQRYAQDMHAKDKVMFLGVSPEKQWHGDPLWGKRILLVGEQGLGDHIQFIRFACELRAVGALSVYAQVRPDLVDLLCTVPGIDQVTSNPPDQDTYDVWCPMLSLPFLLQLSAPRAPLHSPYIFPSTELQLRWSQQLHQWFSNKPKIGIVWAGNPGNSVDGRRSISTAAMLQIVQAKGNAVAVSLQKGDAALDMLDVQCAQGMIPLLDMLNLFSDTAAAIANLDLVISVDTAVAHLAGAMGKEVWLMLPKGPDWRWGLQGNSTPWYPTMRLYRQTMASNWDSVLSQVCTDLQLRYS